MNTNWRRGILWALNALAQPIALATTLVLAIPLCLPPRRHTISEGEEAR